MRGDLFRDAGYFTRGYADHLPAQFMRALKEESAIVAQDCVLLEGTALYRAQGAATILKELIDVLEKGVDAPAPDAGTSSANEPAAMSEHSLY